MRHERQRVFLEIFSGAGALSATLRRRGWKVIEWDIVHGASFDLTVAANIRRLYDMVRSADLVHLGTPCTSFSVARRGRIGDPLGPLRSIASPMGLPNRSNIDQVKIDVGN